MLKSPPLSVSASFSTAPLASVICTLAPGISAPEVPVTLPEIAADAVLAAAGGAAGFDGMQDKAGRAETARAAKNRQGRSISDSPARILRLMLIVLRWLRIVLAFWPEQRCNRRRFIEVNRSI